MDTVAKLLEKKIKPRAEKIDTDRRAVKKAIKAFGRKKLLAVRVPGTYGGLDLPARDYFAFLEKLQSYSGAFGFLQRQHQAAAKFISQSENVSLKKELLPRMAKGKRKVGVSVSHLRNTEHQKIIASAVEGGWSLKGEALWVSGYRIFDSLVVGFFIPDQEKEGMALIRFKQSHTLSVSKPMQTIALSSIQTVHMQLKGHHVPEPHIVTIQPSGEYKKNSTLIGVHFVNLSALALGCKRELEAIGVEQKEMFENLCLEYEECREAFLNRESDDNLHLLYATMHRIATQFCILERLTQKTSALVCPNSCERRYRELMLFGVIVPDFQTLDACLHALI